MTHEAPRESALFSLRQSHIGARVYQSEKLSSTFGPGQAPAYSQDSDIIGCGFSEPTSNFEGPIFTRRIGEAEDGKEMTSLFVNGGAAWCPANNKFYSGAFPPFGNDAYAVIVDPETDVPQAITGFATAFNGNCGRAFWNPNTSDIWLRYGIGGNGFARIDISDNSISYVASATPSDFTYCASNTSIYFTDSFSVYKVTGAGTVTTIFTQSDFETLLGSAVTEWQIGAIEYIDSGDYVAVAIKFRWNPGGGANTFSQLRKIDVTTGATTPLTTAGAGATMPWALIMFYSPQFDRLIADNQGGIASYTPPDFTSATGSPAYGMTARGCFADTPNKVAIPGLKSGAYGVQFYAAADL